MSYRPPFAESLPMNPNRKNHIDEEGWEHVAARNPFGSQRYPNTESMRANRSNTGSRWGQSALGKPAPKPKTREEEFPSLGSGRSKSTSPPPTATATATTNTLSMAERMKIKLVEEEEERLSRVAEEDRRAMEDERDRTRILGFVPMYSIMQTRRAHSTFDTAEDDFNSHHNFDNTFHGAMEFDDEPCFDEPCYDESY